MTRRIRLRARQDEHPVGEVRLGTPGLLAEEPVAIPIALAPEGQGGEVRSRVRLRVALREAALTGEDRGEELLALRLAPMDKEGVAEHLDPEPIVWCALGQAPVRELLGDHYVGPRAEPSTSIAHWPGRRKEAALGKLVSPPEREGQDLVRRKAPDPSESRRHSRREEASELVAELVEGAQDPSPPSR